MIKIAYNLFPRVRDEIVLCNIINNKILKWYSLPFDQKSQKVSVFIVDLSLVRVRTAIFPSVSSSGYCLNLWKVLLFFQFYPLRLFKITFFIFTLFRIKFGELLLLKFMVLSFVFRRWAFYFHFQIFFFNLHFEGCFCKGFGFWVPQFGTLFLAGVRRVMLSYSFFRHLFCCQCLCQRVFRCFVLIPVSLSSRLVCLEFLYLEAG